MKTILVVDDMAVFREPIAISLRSKGFHVTCAGDGEEALQLMARQVPDLILLDIAMPGIDGLAVVRRMKADARLATVPVILLTAVTEKDYIVQAGKLGVRDYLLKSKFSLAELYERVARRLGTGNTGSPEDSAAAPVAASDESIVATSPAAQVASVPVSGAVSCPAGTDRGSAGNEPEGGVSAARRAAYLPASVTPPPILDALKSLSPIRDRAEVVEQLRQCEQLKAFSPVVVQVLKLTNNPHSALDTVVRAISQDQAIALKILKLANSVAYSRGEPVESIQMAVSRIGMERIRQAVFNIGVVDQFGPHVFKGQLNFAQFWEHAVGVGVIAAELAHSMGGELRSDTAFTLGLLHDVGRVVCIDQLGEDYAQVLRTAIDLELPLEQVESRMMLVNHAEVMDIVLRAWRFHEHLIVPISSHHLSADNIRKVALRQMREAATLALANRLAHALLLGSSGNHVIYPTEDLCRHFNLDPAVIEHIQSMAYQQTANIKMTMLSAANQSNWTAVRDQYRAVLPVNFRPLFVSLSPRIDAYRIFCDQLVVPTEDQPPTLAIVHLANPRERASATAAYLAAETQAQTPPLPLIVISPSTELGLEDFAMVGRPHEVLTSPLVVSRFFRAVRQLLSNQIQSAAA